jgi:hypothetical protein
MPRFLVIVEARSRGAVYEVFLDVLERRLGAWRALRSTWIVESPSAETVASSLTFYLPVDDGLLVVPLAEPHLERNLRDAQGNVPAPVTYQIESAGDQPTPE